MNLKICKHEGCDKEPAPGRLECYTCRSREIIKRKPIDMAYYWLKKSAKRRDLPFTITLVWFRTWIKGTDYMESRGRLSESLTIDRPDNLLGYTPDNMQIKSKHDNVCKFHAEDARRELGISFEGEVPF